MAGDSSVFSNQCASRFSGAYLTGIKLFFCISWSTKSAIFAQEFESCFLCRKNPKRSIGTDGTLISNYGSIQVPIGTLPYSPIRF